MISSMERQCAVVFVTVDRLGRADTGNNILALGIDQKFTVEVILAGRGVAGKGHTGGAVIAHVAEDHRLDVDGSTPFRRDIS